MQKLLLFLLLFSGFASAQVIPVGTIIKGKRLPALYSGSETDLNNSSATLYGTIKVNDSKLSIKENGFVVLENSETNLPTTNNARKVMVAGGIADFSITIDDFKSNTTYKYRAYAINSKDEVAYSSVVIFTTYTNFCEINPCKNGATCTSSITGALCLCTVYFCGDCCARLATDPPDYSCPGSSFNVCPLIMESSASSTLTIKNNYYNSIIKSTSDNNIWKSTQNIFSK
jgi:hypothetical protein